MKLESSAKWRIRGLGRRAAGRTEGDLLGEAVTATLSGERRWNKTKVSLVGHLLGVMRSISSHWRRDFDPDEEPTLESDLATTTGDGGVLRRFDLVPSAEPSADRVLEAKERVEAIEQAFADDPVVSLILEGMREGMSPADVRSELSLSQTEYETAMKRLRRKAAAVATGGGSDA